VRVGLSAAAPVADFSRDTKTGGLVPLGGPLILLLSVITHDFAFYQTAELAKNEGRENVV